jgi:16S rRNA (uracil1498-N3)-methyltransferase
MDGCKNLHRFVIQPGYIKNDAAVISGSEAKHMLNVLRLRKGDRFIAFDGMGFEYEMELVSFEDNTAYGRILRKYDPKTEPGIKVILYQGLPKSDKMDLIVQKTVELGIYKIVPVITQFSVPRIRVKDTVRKLERWNRISLEASKQCGRVVVPKVSEPVDYEAALNHWGDMAKARPTGTSMMVFCYEGEAKKCLKDLFKCYNINCVDLVGVFIGPEGGFSPDEIHMAEACGISPVSLGRRTLRTETAAIAVLSVIMHEMSDMLP